MTSQERYPDLELDSAIQGNFTMNTSVVNSTEIQITLNLEQDQTITSDMLSLLKVNNSPLDFSVGGGNASITMGGTTADIKAFINVTGLDTSLVMKYMLILGKIIVRLIHPIRFQLEWTIKLI